LIYPDSLIFSPEVPWKFPDSLILHLRPKLLWTNIKLRESPWAAQSRLVATKAMRALGKQSPSFERQK